MKCKNLLSAVLLFVSLFAAYSQGADPSRMSRTELASEITLRLENFQNKYGSMSGSISILETLLTVSEHNLTAEKTTSKLLLDYGGSMSQELAGTSMLLREKERRLNQAIKVCLILGSVCILSIAGKVVMVVLRAKKIPLPEWMLLWF